VFHEEYHGYTLSDHIRNYDGTNSRNNRAYKTIKKKHDDKILNKHFKISAKRKMCEKTYEMKKRFFSVISVTNFKRA
jgi:hypothetical protein